MSSQSIESLIAAACGEAVRRLTAASIAPEQLAEYVPPRRVLLWTKPATMRPICEVWRLGALLLSTDGALYAAGHATRAAERGRPGYQSQSREERREVAAAALRGGFAEGSPVNFDAVVLFSGESVATEQAEAESPATAVPESRAVAGQPPTLTGPLGIHAGEVRVRWRAGASLENAPSLQAYLSERVSLLIDPPFS